jgi:hypothetical protein
MGILGLSFGYSGWNMKLDNHFHPAQKLRMNEASVISFPFSTETTLLFYFPLKLIIVDSRWLIVMPFSAFCGWFLQEKVFRYNLKAFHHHIYNF